MMSLRKVPWLRYGIFFSFFLFSTLFGLQCATRSLDPDFGWHLRIGQETEKRNTVLTTEEWNTPIIGEKWIDHEWLMNIGFYDIYEHFGYMGLAFISVLLLVLLFGIQQKLLLKKEHGTAAILSLIFLQTFGLFGMSAHLGIRPILISLLLFLAFLEFLKRATTGKKQLLFRILLPVLFLIWGNLHGSFLIGHVIIIGWIILFTLLSAFPSLRKFLERFFEIPAMPSARTQISMVFLFIACVATPLINPYGIDLYHLLSEYWQNNYYLLHISEWLPAWTWPISLWKLSFGAFSFGVVFIWFVTAITSSSKKIPKLPLWETVLFLLFLLLSLTHIRHFPLFFGTALPLLFSFCTVFFPTQFSRKKPFPKIFQIGIPVSFLTFFLVFSATYAKNISFPEDPFAFPKFCKHYPCAATTFLKDSEYRDKVLLNPYAWGGYLLWMWPEKVIFTDGRQPQRSYEGHSLLEESNAFFDKEQIEKKLKKHSIEVVLLRKQKPASFSLFDRYFFGIDEQEVKTTENSLLDFLKNSKDWMQKYEDETAVIFVKK